MAAEEKPSRWRRAGSWAKNSFLFAAVVGAFAGQIAQEASDQGSSLVASGAAAAYDQLQKRRESDAETTARHYVEEAVTDGRWQGDGPSQIHEEGERLLAAEWETLSPETVHQHRGTGRRVGLEELYEGTETFAGKPVVLEAYVSTAHPKLADDPRFVRQELYLGVGTQAAAFCEITRPTDDRLADDDDPDDGRFEGDFVEVRGVALASGNFGGQSTTYLACASAEHAEP